MTARGRPPMPDRVGRFLAGTVLVLAAAALTPAAASAEAPLNVYDQQSVSVGSYPDELAIGDLNGDGRPDVVAPEYLDGSVSVLFQDAEGGYERTVLPGDQNPGDPAIADLDDDGDQDLAVPFESTHVVAIYRQQGDGSLARTDVPVGQTPIDVASGDLEGDGDVDLAVANLGDDSISVLRQGAGGAFDRADLATGPRPIEIAIADMDGDADRDIVASTIGPSSVLLFTQEGDGSFSRSEHFLPSGGQGLDVGDVNGDGRPDVVVANSNVDETTWILRQDAPGSFTRLGIVGHESSSVKLADIDRDGDLDLGLIASVEYGPAFLLNDGGGFFAPGVEFTLSWGGIQDFAIADLNGDGALDLAVSDTGNPNTNPPVRRVLLLTDSGRSVPRCGGRLPTMIGTDGPDRSALQKDDTDDVVSLLGGDDDHLVWNDGNDVVCAGEGDDRVNVLEGAGRKRVYGGPGDDELGDFDDRNRSGLALFGEAGDDLLQGSRDPDTASGGEGDDAIRGGKDNDRLRGNGGRDVIKGDKGEDRANGGGGRDRCRAERRTACER